MNEEELYHKAYSKWGQNAQMWMIVEEQGELLHDLSCYLRGRIGLEKILHEVADVEIMLGQLKYMLFVNHSNELNRESFDALFDRLKNEKLKRLKERLEK